jgi:hypothetical protein
VVGFLTCAVLAILVGDALWARARLRLRADATLRARRSSHELTAGESRRRWRSLEGNGALGTADGRSEMAQLDATLAT